MDMKIVPTAIIALANVYNKSQSDRTRGMTEIAKIASDSLDQIFTHLVTQVGGSICKTNETGTNATIPITTPTIRIYNKFYNFPDTKALDQFNEYVGDACNIIGMQLYIHKDVNHATCVVCDLQGKDDFKGVICLLYTSPSPRDRTRSRMPSSA